MDLAKLDQLKDKLCNEKSFQKIFEYFLDHFGENDEFMSLGQRTRNELVESTMLGVARQFLGERATATTLLLVAIPGTSFMHGGCMVGDRMANVLYFEDIQTGLVALVAFPPGSKPTQLSRFRLQQLPPEAVPSVN